MDIREIASCTDIGQFMELSMQYLQNPTKNEFSDYLKLFGRQSAHSLVGGCSVDLGVIGQRVRELSFSLIVEGGDLPEIEDLFVAVLFEKCYLAPFERATEYIEHVKLGLASDDINDLEKVYFAIFEFYLHIINGKPREGFGNFLRRLAIFHLQEVGSSNIHERIWDLFDAIAFTSDEFFEAIAPIFDKDYYFALLPYQRRSIFGWSLHIFWAIKSLFGHQKWVTLYDAWKSLLYEHIARDECNEAMYVQFFIYHVMGNSYQTQVEWREFNDSVSRKSAEYYMDWAKRNGAKQAKSEQTKEGKIKIGLLRDRIVENSPFKVEWSVLEALMKDETFKDKYSVTVYLMDIYEKSQSDDYNIKMYTDLGIPVINVTTHVYSQGYYNNHLEKATLLRNRIIEDGVDILISPNNGYGISDFIVSTRAAPKQIFWCHGNFEYDVPNIDKRITHIGDGAHQKQSDYVVEHFDYRTHEMFTKPEEERYKELAKITRAKYPKDTVILGSIGRLVKVDSDEYMYAVSEILKQCPNAIYLACGEGNREGIVAKMLKYGIDESRFVFVGWVDPHVYGYVLDVYLNTFPETSGEALNEFLAKGVDKYAVSLTHD
jgi:hypothetical protein